MLREHLGHILMEPDFDAITIQIQRQIESLVPQASGKSLISASLLASHIYIAQAAGIEEAIAKVKTQHPQETGKLEAIAVGGILAPDQVISLDTNQL
ncbi:hypothetical protein [Coleofasciculus sp. H7-2]|uniref:hypothetical protein n=1 Tax=Coleofasciculus sp. H7-2 TaxID=3351545 RepID=UPI00366D915B